MYQAISLKCPAQSQMSEMGCYVNQGNWLFLYAGRSSATARRGVQSNEVSAAQGAILKTAPQPPPTEQEPQKLIQLRQLGILDSKSDL
jgi:hypothetical protein